MFTMHFYPIFPKSGWCTAVTLTDCGTASHGHLILKLVVKMSSSDSNYTSSGNHMVSTTGLCISRGQAYPTLWPLFIFCSLCCTELSQ